MDVTNDLEIRTIGDRMAMLKAYEAENGKVSFLTQVEIFDDGVLAKASAFDYKTEMHLQNGHKFIPFEGVGKKDAISTAETQAMSRCIGFLVRDQRIHSMEELEDAASRKAKGLRQSHRDGASLDELQEMIRSERDLLVKKRMQQAYGSIVSQTVTQNAIDKANKKGK